jgi:hypothetical protein
MTKGNFVVVMYDGLRNQVVDMTREAVIEAYDVLLRCVAFCCISRVTK